MACFATGLSSTDQVAVLIVFVAVGDKRAAVAVHKSTAGGHLGGAGLRTPLGTVGAELG